MLDNKIEKNKNEWITMFFFLSSSLQKREQQQQKNR